MDTKRLLCKNKVKYMLDPMISLIIKSALITKNFDILDDFRRIFWTKCNQDYLYYESNKNYLVVVIVVVICIYRNVNQYNLQNKSEQ